MEVVRLLLEAGADTGTANENGATVLHFAAMDGHSGVVRLLLEAGADTGAADADGATALHVAARNGQLDVLQLLLHYAVRNYFR